MFMFMQRLMLQEEVLNDKFKFIVNNDCKKLLTKFGDYLVQAGQFIVIHIASCKLNLLTTLGISGTEA